MVRTVSKQLRAEFRATALVMLDELKAISQEKFGYCRHPKLRFGWHEKWDEPWAMGLKIFIGAQSIIFTREFEEYDHIKHDSEIGTVKSREWKKKLAVVLAHEYAHVLDDYCKFDRPANAKAHRHIPEGISQVDEKQMAFHMERWQYIYRTLRRHFVNNGRWRAV